MLKTMTAAAALLLAVMCPGSREPRPRFAAIIQPHESFENQWSEFGSRCQNLRVVRERGGVQFLQRCPHHDPQVATVMRTAGSVQSLGCEDYNSRANGRSPP